MPPSPRHLHIIRPRPSLWARIRPTIPFAAVEVAIVVAAIVAAFLMAGCGVDWQLPPEPARHRVAPGVTRFRDEAAHVTCWELYAKGISCLRDEPDGGSR